MVLDRLHAEAELLGDLRRLQPFLEGQQEHVAGFGGQKVHLGLQQINEFNAHLLILPVLFRFFLLPEQAEFGCIALNHAFMLHEIVTAVASGHKKKSGQAFQVIKVGSFSPKLQEGFGRNILRFRFRHVPTGKIQDALVKTAVEQRECFFAASMQPGDDGPIGIVIIVMRRCQATKIPSFVIAKTSRLSQARELSHPELRSSRSPLIDNRKLKGRPSGFAFIWVVSSPIVLPVISHPDI